MADPAKLKQVIRDRNAEIEKLEARLRGEGMAVDADLRPLVEELVQLKVEEAMAEFRSRLENLDEFHGRWPEGATFLRMHLQNGEPIAVYPVRVPGKNKSQNTIIFAEVPQQ